MILLLGGTSETAPLAAALIQAGFTVLVSTATDIPLELDAHPQLRRRSGPLDASGLEGLIRDNTVRVLVDATHPYATAIRTLAAATARRFKIPYLTFVRPGIILESPPGNALGDTSQQFTSVQSGAARPVFAADHFEAARLACAAGKPVLLTTGSRNLSPYAAEARRTGVPLIVRVLPHPDSLAACRAAGIPEDMVIAAKGPFTAEENVELIRRFGIGVLVTKNSGAAGGVPAKIAAAEAEDCHVIIVRRPAVTAELTFGSITMLVDYLLASVTPSARS